MTTAQDQANENLGRAIDRLDNVSSALFLPLKPEMHVHGMKLALPEIVQQLKDAFAKVTGENPWD